MRLADLLDDGTLKKAGTRQALRMAGEAIRTCPEFSSLTPSHSEKLTMALAVLERLEALVGYDERILFGRVIALRKLGRLEDALNSARAGEAQSPSWTTATLIAVTLKHRGELDDAVAMYRVAAERKPQDVSALLDAGDILMDQARWDRALECYEAALERDREQPWAIPSAHFCRYRLTRDPRWLEMLQALATVHPDECGLRDSYAQLVGKSPPGDRQRRAIMLVNRLQGS